MDVDRGVLSGFVSEIETALEDGDVDTAKEDLAGLKEEFGLQINSDQDTIGIHVDVWSYDHDDDLYFVFTEYESPTEAVEEVVAGYVHALLSVSGPSLSTCENRMRDSPSTVTAKSYKSMNPDIELSIHADIYYMRMSAYCDGTESQLARRPSKEKIVEVVNSVDSTSASTSPP